MSETRAISTTLRRELSSIFFFLQGKALKEIHAILTETLACFLPGWAKDLSGTLYNFMYLKINLEVTNENDIEGTCGKETKRHKMDQREQAATIRSMIQ